MYSNISEWCDVRKSHKSLWTMVWEHCLYEYLCSRIFPCEVMSYLKISCDIKLTSSHYGPWCPRIYEVFENDVVGSFHVKSCIKLKSQYSFEYTHYNSWKIKSSLSMLIDSLQLHLSKDVLLSPKFWGIHKVWANSIITSNTACLHLAREWPSAQANTGHYLKFQNSEQCMQGVPWCM